LVEWAVINEKIKKFNEPKNLVLLLFSYTKPVRPLAEKTKIVWSKKLRRNIFRWPGEI
jgi:hypothetical protein